MDAAASPNSAAIFKKKSPPRIVTGNRFILNVGSTPNRSRRLHENSTRKQRGTNESNLVDDIGTDKSTGREEEMSRRRERKGLPAGWDEIDENSLPVVRDAIRSLILSFPTDDAELKDESSLDELSEMRQRYQKEHEKELKKQNALKERLRAETQRQRLLPSEVMSNMRQTSQGGTTILDEVFCSAIREQRALSGISECSESSASASPSAQGFREEDRDWPTRRIQTKRKPRPPPLCLPNTEPRTAQREHSPTLSHFSAVDSDGHPPPQPQTQIRQKVHFVEPSLSSGSTRGNSQRLQDSNPFPSPNSWRIRQTEIESPARTSSCSIDRISHASKDDGSRVFAPSASLKKSTSKSAHLLSSFPFFGRH